MTWVNLFNLIFCVAINHLEKESEAIMILSTKTIESGYRGKAA